MNRLEKYQRTIDRMRARRCPSAPPPKREAPPAPVVTQFSEVDAGDVTTALTGLVQMLGTAIGTAIAGGLKLPTPEVKVEVAAPPPAQNIINVPEQPPATVTVEAVKQEPIDLGPVLKSLTEIKKAVAGIQIPERKPFDVVPERDKDGQVKRWKAVERK